MALCILVLAPVPWICFLVNGFCGLDNKEKKERFLGGGAAIIHWWYRSALVLYQV